MRLAIFFLCFALIACGQKKKYTVDPKAKVLADSAYKLLGQDFYDTGKLRSAIHLLKQATAIDSNYILGFRNTLTYQGILKDYKEALITARRISDLRPQDADILSQVGILYEMNNDTVSSKPYLQRAVNIYTKVLDTASKPDNIFYLRSAKAYNLLLLNQDAEGHAIIKDMLEKNKDTTLNETLRSFLNLTGREIISGMLNEGKDEPLLSN